MRTITYQHPFNCNRCGRPLHPLVCQSNAKGNKGRRYVVCRDKQPDGSCCSYFRWASPPHSASPPSSLPSTPTSPPATPPAPTHDHFQPIPAPSSSALVSSLHEPFQPIPVPSSSALVFSLHEPSHTRSKSNKSNGVQCAVAYCTQTRVAPGCPRKCCRKHCVELGGCEFQTHLIKTSDPCMPATATQRATSAGPSGTQHTITQLPLSAGPSIDCPPLSLWKSKKVKFTSQFTTL